VKKRYTDEQIIGFLQEAEGGQNRLTGAFAMSA
jgi:hypothetical protein